MCFEVSSLFEVSYLALVSLMVQCHYIIYEEIAHLKNISIQKVKKPILIRALEDKVIKQ